jgi:hypothetical protein
MAGRILVGTMVVLLVAVAPPRGAGAAPCVVACKPAIAACASSDCQGFKKRALRHCRRSCKKKIMADCFLDLSVCGATSARRPKAGGAGAGAGGGAGGGMPVGGW